MNIKEIINSLPNGFHDSALKKLTHDFVENSLTLVLDVWMDDEQVDGKFVGNRQQCNLKFTGLKYFSYEPSLFTTNRDKKNLTGSAWVHIDYDYEKVSKPINLSGGPNSGWIFFKDFNGFVHFDAEEIEFEWNI